MTERARERGLKLLNLWRSAQGGEKQKARGALMRVLEGADLYLSDLETGLPRLRDPEAAPDAQTAQVLTALSHLDSPQHRDEALNLLVDAPGLTPQQRQRVLQVLDAARLAEIRAAGWAASQPDPEVTPEVMVRAAAELSEAALCADSAPTLAASLRNLSLLTAARLARPERLLRADDEYQAAFLQALCFSLSGVPASSCAEGEQCSVRAYLSANELAQVRAPRPRNATTAA